MPTLMRTLVKGTELDLPVLVVELSLFRDRKIVGN